MEFIQYNGCLAITEAIRGTSKEQIYQELGLESLLLHNWYRKLCLFDKVFKNKHPKYLFNLIPISSTPYVARTVDTIPFNKRKQNFFYFFFFPSTIIEWNNLDLSLKSVSIFKKKILYLMWPSPSYIFDCHNPKWIKHITKTRSEPFKRT